MRAVIAVVVLALARVLRPEIAAIAPRPRQFVLARFPVPAEGIAGVVGDAIGARAIPALFVAPAIYARKERQIALQKIEIADRFRQTRIAERLLAIREKIEMRAIIAAPAPAGLRSRIARRIVRSALRLKNVEGGPAAVAFARNDLPPQFKCARFAEARFGGSGSRRTFSA